MPSPIPSASNNLPRSTSAITSPRLAVSSGIPCSLTSPSATHTYVDFHNGYRAPRLLLGGGADHLEPAAVSRSNFKHYKKSAAVTEYHEFPGRAHYTIGQDGWEQVADYALTWATQNAQAREGQPHAELDN